MNIMFKITASFFAPFVLSSFFLLYNVIFDMIHNYSFKFVFEGIGFGFFIIYIFALPAYLFIGVPISLIIERINEGIQWINYSLAGIAGGLILVFIINKSSLQELDDILGAFFLWAAAGLSYYISLVILEKLVQKLRNREE